MIDGGQGFLKVSLSVLPPNYIPMTDTAFKEGSGVSDEKRENTGLKRDPRLTRDELPWVIN